ncbi:Luciferase-like monooxygenase [Kribbella flavida DSM 17836]|uniref:Luciferase-like monooxygenase n=1 Tax=Kribbella flavida (strain DSM 17836 / JCM 10339 / NBRC 14399) TaxID=479435 RepID=D2PRE3_KRIFD|nr:LLM class flavin-dependent oxidoreductase [Kribbella flavida]ADB34861.1 Luciferase-like monooxygenase [Kribbella flavida DSM 17836]
MKFSVTFGAVGAGRDPRGLAELARVAEQCGWDGMFLEDYLIYQGDASAAAYDPWVCLAAMACATSRIHLGTTVTPLPRRRPWKVAAEAVALDHLSGGRMILGVGIGDPTDPFLADVGEATDPRVLAEMLDEALEVIDALWTGEPVHHSGRHYQLDGVRLAARPVQRPRIPVWVGGNMLVPAVRRRILRWDGSCAYKGPTTASLPITPEDVAALRAERGDAAFALKVSGGDPAAFAAAGATWWGRWVPPGPFEDALAVVRGGPPRN